jgi:sialidase-1
MGENERPFFEKIRVWEPEAGIQSESIYLELTSSGEILALGHKVPSARWPGGYDHGFPWLHLRARSVDGGLSWELEEKNWWEPETRPRCASVVDVSTGEIFLFNLGTWPLQDDQGKPMSESWMVVNHKKARQLGATLTMERSCDDGRTWTSVDMTEQFFTYPGAGLAWFIGKGIQLQRGAHAGRLIIPGRYFTGDWKEIDPDKHNVLYHHPALGSVYDDGFGQVAQVLDETARNMVIYSDNHGESWNWGGSSQGFVGEACLVELEDGSVYMNNRNHDPRSMGYRSWCISCDGGETFAEFGVDDTLIESRCHAALVRYSSTQDDEPGRVLFSNPAVFEGVNQLHTLELGKAARANLTVRVSYDDCKSWPVSRQLDEEATYSSLVVLDDGTILCGCRAHVYRFNMAWLEQQS